MRERIAVRRRASLRLWRSPEPCVNVSAEWVREQAAKRTQKAVAASVPVTEGWQDGALVVWVEGRPHNPLNGQRGHWAKHARWAKEWRERAAGHILAAQGIGKMYITSPTITNHGVVGVRWPWPAVALKRITFTVYGPSRFDDDNLRAVAKPVRDSLKDMGVIDDDRPSSGHTFVYTQAKPARSAGASYGIALRIELAKATSPSPQEA